jgi:hypothetical protein
MYASEREKYAAARYPGGFGEIDAGEVFGAHLQAVTDDHVIELSGIDRERIFNLGYYTWVEQQGVPLDDFDRRREQSLWRGFQAAIPRWDALIEAFNAEARVNRPG